MIDWLIEIFHFEIFKNFMEILKYFKTPSLKYFMKFLIFIMKWLKTFKNMIKAHEVSRKCIMLFMHNNRYLPLTGLLTLYGPKKSIVKCLKYFRNISRNISWNISRQKISCKFYTTSYKRIGESSLVFSIRAHATRCGLVAWVWPWTSTSFISTLTI